jgi:hypothetical protein
MELRMSFASLRLAPLLVALVFMVPAHAEVKGELWELTVKMQMKDMPMDMPARTTRTCMDKNAKDEAFVPQKSAEGECRMADQKRSGNVWRYRMECVGRDKDTVVTEGEVTYAADRSYTGKMRMTGKSGDQGYEMTQTFSGRKVGDCTK